MKTLEQVFGGTKEQLEAIGYTVNGLAIHRGTGSYAEGEKAIADGYYAMAIGKNANAIGAWAKAIGKNANAHGRGAIAAGYNAVARCKKAIAIGNGTEAIGENTKDIRGECDDEFKTNLKRRKQ